jgi:hypothetical protein
MKFIVLLCIVLANWPLLGQTSSPREAGAAVANPSVNRLEQLSKSFPPEVMLPVATPGNETPLWSYCVYPTPDTKSVSVKPCQPATRTLRLIPPFETIALPAKPDTVPSDIR